MRFRMLGLAVAAASMALTAAPAAAAARTPAAPRPAGSPARAAGPSVPHQVLFVDGERALVMRRGGGTEVAPVSLAGQDPAGASMELSTGGRTYDLPLAALPFLGRGLDPSLFDAAALLGRESGGRIPVQVRYQGAAAPRIPGITITAPGSGAAGIARTASGYLTASSARVFGAALDRQYLADHAGASYGTDGIFANDTSVSLAGAVSVQAVRPQFAMHTLTITGTDLSGHPDTGDVVLIFNVDNGNLNAVIASTQVFSHGIAKVSLPAGHYFAIAGYTKAAPGSVYVTDAHLDVLPQFSVTANTTVHTSAKAAASRVTMVTPRPAKAESSDFSVLRTSASGPPSQAFISTPGAAIWVSPTSRKPATGKLTSYTAQQLASPPGPGIPYQYELSYADPSGVIPQQTHHVRPGGLATVTDKFYQDVPESGLWNMYGAAINPIGFPGAGYINPFPDPITLPGRQVRYIGGNAPATMWAAYYSARDTAGQYLGGVSDLMRTVQPGKRLIDNWNQYPLHPGPNINPDPRSAYNWLLPSASREGNTLTVSVTPFDDNQPGHMGDGTIGISGATTTGTYQIDQDGTQIAGGSVPIGPSGSAAFTTQATLSPAPSTIRFELHATQTGPAFPLSSASTTVWTWRSSHESGHKLPHGWYCDDATSSRHCGVEPMMTLLYHVHGMALNGSTAPGRQVLDVTAGHIPLASRSSVKNPTVQVSFDDGATWHRARVTSEGAGKYRASYNAPAGVYVTLRTTATDTAGGRITETISRGYQVAS